MRRREPRQTPEVDLPASFSIPFDAFLDVTEELIDAAKEGIETRRRLRAPRRGATLRPGSQTPLWNVLVGQVNAAFTGRYGEKAALGRFLGLPRQRINDLLHRRHHMPDAERTLRLLWWLQIRRQGGDSG